MRFELIFAAAPIRWADPRTWPWVVWVWLAMLFSGAPSRFGRVSTGSEPKSVRAVKATRQGR